jgi:SET domain-containing protein
VRGVPKYLQDGNGQWIHHFVFTAIRGIAPGEQLVQSYGPNYKWPENETVRCPGCGKTRKGNCVNVCLSSCETQVWINLRFYLVWQGGFLIKFGALRFRL